MSSTVHFMAGEGGLPMLRVETPVSEMEMYLHGAHVTGFRKKCEAQPILFMSPRSKFEAGKAIRGGVPIIFPWFGPREGKASHGFARTAGWEVTAIETLDGGHVAVSLKMKPVAQSSEYPPCVVGFRVVVGETLEMELSVANSSPTDALGFEQCLHTYFTVGDISSVSVAGLKGSSYVDRLAAPGEKIETADVIQISSEFDRTYYGTPATIEIRDKSLSRTILVEKEGSLSTVVWNPWIDKSKALGEFEEGAYRKMICVESGGIARDSIHLKPLEKSTLKVRLSSRPGA